MRPVVLRAHFDGRQIKLDEPYDLPRDARLVVAVLPEGTEDVDWHALSLATLGRAYGRDEPEYPLSMVAEPRPDERG